MGEERIKYGVHILTAGLLVLLVSMLSVANAYAQQSVVINPPINSHLNQPFQMRTATRAHRGHDYRAHCGTPVTTPATVQTCQMRGGYGLLGTVSHGCGVTTNYAHLDECHAGTTNIKTGGARGTRNAGNSEACHLHYEILIDGSQVNPASAFGQNLCDPAVRQKLLKEAKDILGSHAGGGGGAATPGQTEGSGTPGQTTTDSNNIQSAVYIPGGTTTNPGVGYYQVTYVDGRVVNHVDLRAQEVTVSQLPPTTEEFIQSTNSTNNPVTGCATDTWTAMVNQAVLQTRREMAINQRYIVKPDSVMAYSCLSEQLKLVGEHAGVLSESKRWANKQVDILNGNTATVTVDMGSNSLDGAINNVAAQPYESYLQSLFNYDFLAGQAAGLTGSPQDDESGVSQMHAPCGAMSKVWQIAKCMNVTDDPLFPKFEELIGKDPRKYPSSYACNDTGITQNMIDTARGSKAKKDNVDTYLEMLYTGACHPPISTGITVYRREGAEQISKERTYSDGLCITIGCSYQNTGSGNGRCEVKHP